jgi:hypothetical protein
MISVSIFINLKPVYTRTARNIGQKGSICSYELDTGEIIEHNPDEGAVVLAKKMLDTIKEVG